MKIGFRTVIVVLSLCAGGLVAIAACSNQGEGEVCDVLNGNEDCADGLVCYRQADLNNVQSDRCCPSDRNTATHPACTTPKNIGGTDAAAPADTGPPSTVDSSVVDAADADAADAMDADVRDATDDG